MNEQEIKFARFRGLTLEFVPKSALDENDIYCVVCECYVRREDLVRWTGDDQLHYLCPGCDSDLLPVENLE